MEVSDGQRQFTVEPFQVTNDLDVAAQIGKASVAESAAASAANRERTQQTAAIVAQQQSSAAEAQAVQLAAIAKKQREARLAAFQAEKNTLVTKIQEANEAEQRHLSGRVIGRTTSLPAVVAQRPAMRTRLATVNDEIRRLERELSQ